MMKTKELKDKLIDVNKSFEALASLKIELQTKLNQIKDEIKESGDNELSKIIEKYTSHIIWGMKKANEGVNSLTLAFNGKIGKFDV